MHRSNLVVVAAVAVLMAEATVSGVARAQTRDCAIGGDIGPIGANSTGTIEMNAGETCRMHLRASGTLESSHVSRQPTNGTLVLQGGGNATYKPREGFKGTDEFAVTIEGRGQTPIGTHSGNTTSILTIRANVE
jgi:hypothetical protein